MRPDRFFKAMKVAPPNDSTLSNRSFNEKRPSAYKRALQRIKKAQRMVLEEEQRSNIVVLDDEMPQIKSSPARRLEPMPSLQSFHDL